MLADIRLERNRTNRATIASAAMRACAQPTENRGTTLHRMWEQKRHE